MKHETKISNLALVCALCAVVASPAMAAAPVRALGGAGTYSSASSAAASKATGSTSGATSTRAGALRVAPSTVKATTSATTATTAKPATTASTTTRVSTTPRLSIGKYLGGTPSKVVVSNGSSSGGGEFVDKIVFEGTVEQVRELEAALTELAADMQSGLAEKQDILTAGSYIEISEDDTISLKYDELKAELEAIAGSDVDISYDAGKLSWTIDGETETIEFSEEFATAADIQALDEEINGKLDDLALRVAELESWVELNAPELELAVTNLRALIGAKTEIGEYVTVGELAQVSEKLNELVLGGAVTGEQLASLEKNLKELIEEKHKSGDYATKAALELVVQTLDEGYYTKDQVDTKFNQLGDLAYLDSIDASVIDGEITAAQLADGAVIADKISTLGTELAMGQYVMMQSDGNGGVTWVAVDVVE